MVSIPPVFPVTIPDEASIDAFALLALQVPPGTLPDNVSVLVGQIAATPNIEPVIVAGLIVIMVVAISIPQVPDTV